MEAQTQCGYATLLRSRDLPGDRVRAIELARAAAATADARGLEGLRRYAALLTTD
jgi:hypothetical protein